LLNKIYLSKIARFAKGTVTFWATADFEAGVVERLTNPDVS
jgi:hypothetical protein